MLPIVVLSAFATASDLPAGRYVESRTAAVFAGACHYNGEYCADGREAKAVAPAATICHNRPKPDRRPA